MRLQRSHNGRCPLREPDPDREPGRLPRRMDLDFQEMASTRLQESEPRRRMVMQLHLLRGSFVAGDAAAGSGSGGGSSSSDSGCAIMDAEVWGRLPDDILWRVLLLVPAAKQFQMHSVSRKWRQLLTSAEFRKSVTAIAAATAPIEARVVAYAAPSGDARRGSSTSHGRSSTVCKVVEIDLTGLVPGWFWKSESYCVVAAADGLVCISNNGQVEEDYDRDARAEWVPDTVEDYDRFVREEERVLQTTRYCVLNPVTRTCTVLPILPFLPRRWLPPSADAPLTIYNSHWEVATYNLAGAVAGEWARVPAAHMPVRVFPGPLGTTHPEPWERPVPPVLARCGAAGGTVYWYLDGRVHVLAAGPGGPAAAVLDGPSVAQLGLDPAYVRYIDENVFLAAHRGALFLVASLSRPNARAAWSGVPCGVWRLARGDDAVAVDVNRQVVWEPVACLRLRDIERLTGLSGVQEQDLCICGAQGARELVCCHLLVYDANWMDLPDSTPSSFLLGFNLDTGEWELVHRDQDGVRWEPGAGGADQSLVIPKLKAVELRPDLFLFS